MQRFAKGAGDKKPVPPLTSSSIRALGAHGMVSLVPGKSHGLCMPAALCNDAARADALREVLKVREDVKAGIMPMWLMRKYYPDEWGKFPETIPEPLARAHEKFNLPAPLSFDDPAGLANVVHMDNPIDLGLILHWWLLNQGAISKDASDEGYDFLANVVEAMADMARAASIYARKAFEAKCWFMLPRPEEVHGSKDITAYDEGSPAHSTYPAGHGAIAFAEAQFLMKRFVLVGEDGKRIPLPMHILKPLFDSAYIWAMARTMAGVHFAVDNLPFAVLRSEV